MEAKSGNVEQAVKHWRIAASAGEHDSMDNLLIAFNKGLVSSVGDAQTGASTSSSCGSMIDKCRI